MTETINILKIIPTESPRPLPDHSTKRTEPTSTSKYPTNSQSSTWTQQWKLKLLSLIFSKYKEKLEIQLAILRFGGKFEWKWLRNSKLSALPHGSRRSIGICTT